MVLLDEPFGALFSNPSVMLIAPRRAGDARLRRALAPLIGKIPVEAVRAANLSVDRDQDKLAPGTAAKALAERLTPLTK